MPLEQTTRLVTARRPPRWIGTPDLDQGYAAITRTTFHSARRRPHDRSTPPTPFSMLLIGASTVTPTIQGHRHNIHGPKPPPLPPSPQLLATKGKARQSSPSTPLDKPCAAVCPPTRMVRSTPPPPTMPRLEGRAPRQCTSIEREEWVNPQPTWRWIYTPR